MNTLDNYFINHTYNDKYINGDLEFIVMLMRGLLKNYESISLDNIRTGLKYMNRSIYAHIEVVYTYNKAFYDDFYEVLDRILGKLHFELRLKEIDMKLSNDDIEDY